jgi:hypothetical protein
VEKERNQLRRRGKRRWRKDKSESVFIKIKRQEVGEESNICEAAIF